MVGNNKGRYAVLGEHAVARTGKPVTGARKGHACNAEILEDRRRVLPVTTSCFPDSRRTSCGFVRLLMRLGDRSGPFRAGRYPADASCWAERA